LTTLLLSAVVAAALPLALLAGGWLQLRRDFLFFGVYLQGLLYVHLGPYLYARAHPPPTLDAYRSFALSALPLFDAALLIAYVLVLGLRRAPVRFVPPERLELKDRHFKLLVFALLAFAVTFWCVAWSAGLMYRRIGVNILVSQQLNLPFASFFVYRLYIESLFDELSTEVKVLFDRRDAASVLWPKRQTIETLLEVLNSVELSPVWAEDEVIGWVYQYFNSGDERRAIAADESCDYCSCRYSSCSTTSSDRQTCCCSARLC